jgi:hypothetical protein
MRHRNPRQVFPINTCKRHKTSNNGQPLGINTSSFLLPPLLRRQCYFIPFVDVHGDQESRSPKSSSVILHKERANKFLGHVLRDCSIASPFSSSRLIYLFIDDAWRLVASTVNSVSLRTILRNLLLSRKTHT